MFLEGSGFLRLMVHGLHRVGTIFGLATMSLIYTLRI